MPAVMTRLDPAPHPADTSWSDPSPRATTPAPVLVVATRPIGMGPALLIHVYDTLPAEGAAPEGSSRCPRAVFLPGVATGTPRFATVVEFDGPRTAEWVAAEQRASHDRLHPASRDVPGFVGAVHVTQDDGGVVVVSLAETAEALQESVDRILSTELLPGEDPTLLSGPDRTTFSSVVRADLPATVHG